VDDKIGNLANMTNGWISHFFSADREVKWHFAELEHSVWLTPNTLLVGRMDAGGENEAGLFFGEWKTANPRERNTWKQVWRMNPQSLTYGVLANDYFQKTLGRGCNQFTVRKAFKSNPPTYDHAWYSYNQEELNHWRSELVRVADEIRQYKAVGFDPYPTNWDSCFKFGINYACPHFEQGCSKMKWDIPVDTVRRVSHLEIERRLNEPNAWITKKPHGCTVDCCTAPEGLVILDATRVKTWLTCRERFRREYVENVATPVTEALEIGINFHEVIGQHYTQLVNQQKGTQDERSISA
jgi:PD-(D/E)XK nuclease superfamily protein